MNGTNDQGVKLNSINRLKEMDAFFRDILKARLFKDYTKEPACIRNIIERFDGMINYNVPHGKKIRGLCVYESLSILLNLDLDDEKCDRDNLLIEQTLATAWCIEFLQASFLVADDIMDKSITRRGQKCWYLTDDTGTMAINDAFYLISLVYKIIHEFTNSHPMYNKLYEVFTEALTNTVVGQGLDLITPAKALKDGKFDFTNYHEDQYYAIVKWKTAYYSFCLPIQSALYLAKIDDTDIHQTCKDILIDMGVFFQVQDDYIDCYGDPKVTGKIGTDIEESKCSWLVVQALKRSSPEQRCLLEDSYGKSDPESVSKVKGLFNELDLQKVYQEYEQERFDKIMSQINDLTFANSGHTHQIQLVLKNYARKIFKRKK